MLSLFKPTRVASDSDSSSSSDDDGVIPAGTPYLTKINGKLAWARKKTPKPANPVQDLLEEAFGSRAVIVRRGSRSLERHVSGVTPAAAPVVQQHQHQIAYSAPLLQQPFSNGMPPMAHYPYHTPQYPPQFLMQPMPQPGPQPQQPPQLYIPQQPPAPAPLFVQQSPTEKEKEQLKVFDAHFNETVKPKSGIFTSVSSEDSHEKQQENQQENQQDKQQDKPQEKVTEESTMKVKIAVTRHVCGDCGRLRSRKYHHDHPLKPGEIPELAFCRKCQKDESSTSELSDAENTKRKKQRKPKKKIKKGNAPSKKPTESSGEEEESSDHPEPEIPKKPKPDQTKPDQSKKRLLSKQARSEDYIIVEEEISDHERQHRGRSHSQASRGHDAPRRSLSPVASQLSALGSYFKPSGHKYSKSVPHPIEIHESFRNTVRTRSPHIQYRYVEVIPSDVGPFDRKEPSHPRKVPIQFVEEEVHEKPTFSRHSQYSERLHDRASSHLTYSVEEPESLARSQYARGHDFDREQSIRPPPSSRQGSFEVREESRRGPPSREGSFYERDESIRGSPSARYERSEAREKPRRGPPSRENSLYERDESTRGPPSRHESFEVRETARRRPPIRQHSFEVPDTMSSMRSADARRRRKRERAPPGTPDFHPWEEPHDIHPGSDDEVVVVTETYEYRKKKSAQDEEERRRQEYIDRATLSPRQTNNNQFSTEDAARYYHNDWSRAEQEFVLPSIVGKPYQPYQPAKAKKGYRRDRYPDSEVTESEVSYDFGMPGTYPDQQSPRAPSPPSPNYQSTANDWSTPKPTNWDNELPYPLSSGPEYASRVGKVVHMPPIDTPYRHRSNTNARPAYVREATDGGTERALVISPRHSNERVRDPFYDDLRSDLTKMQLEGGDREWERERYEESSASGTNLTGLTEFERRAEAESRHVTFRDTPETRSVRDEWSASEGYTGSQRSRSEFDG